MYAYAYAIHRIMCIACSKLGLSRFGSSEQKLTRVSVGIEECIKGYFSNRVCNALLGELRLFNAEDYP